MCIQNLTGHFHLMATTLEVEMTHFRITDEATEAQGRVFA